MDIHTAIQTLQALEGRGGRFEVKVKGRDRRSHRMLKDELRGMPFTVERGEDEVRVTVASNHVDVITAEVMAALDVEGRIRPVRVGFFYDGYEKRTNNGITTVRFTRSR